MKRLLSASSAALVLLSVMAAPASAVPLWRRSVGFTALDPCASDGHLDAPAGTPLYASRAAGWAFPPPCQVVDVHFPAGATNGCGGCFSPTDLGALPPGVTYNSARHRVECNGTNNVTISNLDFTKLVHSGGGILISGCNNVTIRNVKIFVNCADPEVPYPIRQQTDSTNIYISKVTIDSDGHAAAACFGSVGEFVYLTGSGAQEVTYSRFTQPTQHFITFACQAGAACTSRFSYNSASAVGQDQGEHTNGGQWLGSFLHTTYDHNFLLNPQPTFPLEDGVLTLDTINGSREAQGHFAAPIGQSSLLVGMSITSANVPVGTTLTRVDDASVNPTVQLSQAATTSASGVPAGILNAYPIGMTTAVNYAIQGATSSSFDAVISDNVFDCSSPIKGGTYAIKVAGDPGAGVNVDGVQVLRNYFCPVGYSGGFLQVAPGVLNLTVAGNKRLDTGETVP